MSLKLYMDHHIHAAVTKGLIERGIDVLTAYDDNHGGSNDEVILIRATQLGRVLDTQDEDFLLLAMQHQSQEQTFSGIIFSRQLVMTVGAAIRDLELISRIAEPVELLNQVFFLPL